MTAARHGLKRQAKLDPKESEIIENETRAYIAQSVNDEGGIYPILNSMDPTVAKALEVFNAKPLY